MPEFTATYRHKNPNLSLESHIFYAKNGKIALERAEEMAQKRGIELIKLQKTLMSKEL